jgi:hypothetical protein
VDLDFFGGFFNNDFKAQCMLNNTVAMLAFYYFADAFLNFLIFLLLLSMLLNMFKKMQQIRTTLCKLTFKVSS